MMEHLAVPLEAVLGEVLTARLFRHWLLAQGSRVFPVRAQRVRNALGYYLEASVGYCVTLHTSQCPPWVVEFANWSYVHCGTYTAAEAVDALDTIVAGMPL